MSVSKVDCSELPEWAAVGRLPANLGRGRRLFATELQRTAVDFSKLQVLAAHFGQDCRGLWQGKPLYFKGNRCSRLWKLTALIRQGFLTDRGLGGFEPPLLLLHVRFGLRQSVHLPCLPPAAVPVDLRIA